MKVSVEFKKIEAKDNTYGSSMQKCIIVTDQDENTFSFKSILEYINTPYYLSKIEKMFRDERNSAVWIYYKEGFVHYGNLGSFASLPIAMRNLGIIPVLFIPLERDEVYVAPVKAPTLSIKKGDKVKTKDGQIGVISKYPSNSAIELKVDDNLNGMTNHIIVSKDQIVEKL